MYILIRMKDKTFIYTNKIQIHKVDNNISTIVFIRKSNA